MPLSTPPPLGIQLPAFYRFRRDLFPRAMQTMRNDFRAAATLTVLLAALNGCGKTEHAGSAPAPAPAPGRHAAKVPQDAGALALANMVNAVGTGKPYTDIELKFDLRSRPVVGEPVDIDLALIPTQDLDRVSATFQAVEGIELTKGGRSPEFAHPPAGVPISHTLTVIPQRDGVFYVSAVVLADTGTDSVTRNFSIPLIAGAGNSVPAAPDTAAPGATAPAARRH